MVGGGADGLGGGYIGSLAVLHGVALIEHDFGHEVLYIHVGKGVVGLVILCAPFDLAQLDLVDLEGRLGVARGARGGGDERLGELRFGGEEYLKALDRKAEEFIAAPVYHEVEAVAHVGGIARDGVFRLRVGARHGAVASIVLGGLQRLCVVPAAGGLVEVFGAGAVAAQNVLVVEIVDQRDAVAREAEALGQADHHIGVVRLSSFEAEVAVIFYKVARRVGELACRGEIPVVRNRDSERQLFVLPDGTTAVLKTYLLTGGKGGDKFARRGADKYILRCYFRRSHCHEHDDNGNDTQKVIFSHYSFTYGFCYRCASFNVAKQKWRVSC